MSVSGFIPKGTVSKWLYSKIGGKSLKEIEEQAKAKQENTPITIGDILLRYMYFAIGWFVEVGAIVYYTLNKI